MPLAKLVAFDWLKKLCSPKNKLIFFCFVDGKIEEKNLVKLAISYTCLQAFLLSGVSLSLSLFLSCPLFFLTELDVQSSVVTGEVFSYCYEVGDAV